MILSTIIPTENPENPLMISPEGKMDWYYEMSWDKKIMMLNASRFVYNFADIGATRELGFKLICTRSDKVFEDGYYYYNSTYFESNITNPNPILRPYVRHVSFLNNDSYPQYIPKEWDIFDPATIVGSFLKEFDTSPLINKYARENVPIIALAISGIVAASSALTYAISGLFDFIKSKRKIKVDNDD
jgi:hypothetical protein